MGDISRATALVSLSHGERANTELAKLAEMHRIPRILPREVAEAGVGVCYIQKGEDTHTFLMAANGLCRGMDWNWVILIAHPDHLWRAVRVAKKLGMKVMTVDVSSVHYDSAFHKWCFRCHELVARLYYWHKKWI
ncbi:MAG: hypothetical protein WCO03_01895 [bacterium]